MFASNAGAGHSSPFLEHEWKDPIEGFLASEDASYVTGESLVVDGGMPLMAPRAE